MLLRWLAATPENPRFSLNDPAAWDGLLGGEPSAAGVRVTRETALTYGPWWRGVNLIAGGVARLPLLVYRRSGRGKEVATDHPAYRLLRRKANPYQTASQLRLQLTAHAVAGGNGYAYVQRDGAGTPLELWPLDPDSTCPVRADGEVWYVTRADGRESRLPYEDVVHVKGLGFDGLVGYGAFDKAREALGLGLGTGRYSARFFGNGAKPGVVLETPQKLTESASRELRESWERIHKGLDAAHRTAVLHSGLAAKVVSFNAEDSQLIESRQFSIREVANFLGVPPHKLGDTSRTGYASLEQENLSYLAESLDPWLSAWEEECWDTLLTEEEKADESVAVEFHRASLARSDRTSMSNYLRTALGGAPWLTRNEARDIEGLNPVEGGDDILDPANMGDPGGQPSPAGEVKREDQKQIPPGAVRGVLLDAGTRAARRIGVHARRAAGDPAKYLAWLDAFPAEHAPVVAEMLAPGLALVAAGDPTACAGWLLAEAHATLSGVADRATAADLSRSVDAAMGGLELGLPGRLADRTLSES